MIIIDRFEEEYAVCEKEDMVMVNILLTIKRRKDLRKKLKNSQIICGNNSVNLIKKIC